MEIKPADHEVEIALKTVLADPKFMAAPQMSAFLRFVVTQTLEGNSERIKAYTVAVDALGKPDSFDPQNDPSVRVLAKRLRDTLSAYYERTEGHRIFLRLHAGSYIPEFEVASNAEQFGSASNVTSIAQHGLAARKSMDSANAADEHQALGFSGNAFVKP